MAMAMTSPPPSASLRELLALERFELHAPAVPRRAARSPSRRALSSRHASPPPPPCEEGGVRDGGAAGAVAAMLSGYAGRFLKDADFRRGLREKCVACLAAAARLGAGHAVLANLELGIESIERLAADGAAPRDAKIRSLRNSIRLLSVVASLPAPPRAAATAESYTCGVPNSHLSACAQLYLSVVYRMERNDHVSARHLLQVFVDAPYLARKNLLPDLWDHVFLPHLLHLKVWFTKEAELVADRNVDDRSRRMKSLQRLYNDHMNSGTAKFAMYYKEWLKCGADAPPVPSVPLPSMPGDFDTWGKQSASVRRSSINRSLYNAVFGTALEQEDVKDAKLADEAELVVETDIELNDNSGSLKLEKLAHAAVVLYLMKPKAKQMLSLDWIPVVLHILECGDEVQFLSSVKCSPKVAALYFLDQLLMGFDVDRNVENTKQMISLGGLDLLMSRLEVADARESQNCISLLTSCIQDSKLMAVVDTRHYIADNLKEPIVQLLVGTQKKASATALNLMSELVCLNRLSHMMMKTIDGSMC